MAGCPLLPCLAFFSAFLLLTNAEARSSKPPTNTLGFTEIAPMQLQFQRLRASWTRKSVAAADTAAEAEPFTTHYFPQELDHFTFTPNSCNIFYQKYLVNDTFWRRSAGPMFVYLGGQASVEWIATATGFMFDIAPKFGALLVFIEHRFYGDSLPFGNDSYNSAETLGYLTSTQALAEFAILITSLKQNLSAVDSPVVVFGGSYAGMLASWFRIKYPHIAMGAVASSAPILQFDYITPWTSFYNTISQDYKSESPNSFSVIKAVWDVLDSRGSSEKGLVELSKIFRACETVQSLDSLNNWLQTAFIYSAMLDYPVPTTWPAYPVKKICTIIDSFPEGADIIEKAFAGASYYYNHTGDKTCFHIDDAELQANFSDNSIAGWYWQACTEMIMPMTISNESMFQPHIFSYEEISLSCFAQYGVLPRIHWITTEYGGNNIYQVLKRFGSNIIFSNGMRDPWSRGGVLKNISSSIVAIVTDKGSHYLDFISATKDDPDWLVEQRRQEVEIIQGWIDQYDEDIAQMSQ